MKKRLLISILFLSVLMIGLLVGLVLVRRRQIITKKASTPSGQATISLSPSSGTFRVGDTFSVQIFFNTAGISISAISVRLNYPYQGVTPEIIASKPSINSGLLSSADWVCPVMSVGSQAGLVNVDLACINTNISGFSSSSDTLLADVEFTVNSIPSINPITFSFDAEKSVITQKSNGIDILLTPLGTGVYTILETTPTASPRATEFPLPLPTVAPNKTYLPSDINQDEKVDLADYIILFQNFAKTTLTNSRADINGDGKVNLLDYVKLFENFGKTN